MIDNLIELKLIKILKKYNRDTSHNLTILKQFYSEGLSGEPFNKVFKERLKLRDLEVQNAINVDFEKMCNDAYILGNGKQTRLLEVVKLAIEERKMIVVGDIDDDENNVPDEWDDDMDTEDKVFLNQNRIYKNNQIQFKKDLEIFWGDGI